MIRFTFIFGFLFATSSGQLFRKSINDFKTGNNVDITGYIENRANFLAHEFQMTLGYNLSLTPIEELANEVISKAKMTEIGKGFLDPAKFTPAHSILETLNEIRKSPLYNIIRKMPKGGILHAHDSALGSANILVDLTYNEFCWICIHDDGTLEFFFSMNQPNKTGKCNMWELMVDYRRNGGISDEELSGHFKLNISSDYKDANDIWSAFEPVFDIAGSILKYKPNFEKQLERTLEELLLDGVQYVELRSSIRRVSEYELFFILY